MTADVNDACASPPLPPSSRPSRHGTAYATAACFRGGADVAGDDGADVGGGDAADEQPFTAVMATAAVQGLAGGIKQNRLFLDHVRDFRALHGDSSNGHSLKALLCVERRVCLRD